MDTVVKSSLVIHCDASVLTVADVVTLFDLIGKLHNNSSDSKLHNKHPNLMVCLYFIVLWGRMR